MALLIWTVIIGCIYQLSDAKIIGHESIHRTVHADQPNSDGHCIWYGKCSDKLNCIYNGTARALNDTDALKIVRELCPDLVKGDSNPKLCCDGAQLRDFQINMNLPRQVFARCPSCSRNFLQLWCQSTCSPSQSRFIKVTRSTPPTVDSIEYHLTDDFVFGLYNSCRNVQFPGTNEPALSVVCGRPADKCTVDLWLQFMGDPSINPLVPFRIDFKRHNESHVGELIPQNGTMVPCNRAPDEQSPPCSCQDCQESCSPVAPYPAPQQGHCNVGRLDCWTFTALLIFLITFVAIVSAALLHELVASRRIRLADSAATTRAAAAPITEKDISAWERAGAWMERKLESTFTAWGRICVRRPWIVLAFGISVSSVCTCGLYFMDVTTDPVQLWSSPSSRARLEKNYFDEKFGPFYRTEQIILLPRNQSGFVARDGETGEDWYYGPVFAKELLHRVLRLQEEIADLEVVVNNRTVKLQDICFQPMAPDNTGCTIMSVTNYFQNNHSLIDYTHLDIMGDPDSDYLTHLRSCFGSPTQMADSTPGHQPCMAEFGGPIFPYVVLGGFGAYCWTTNDTEKDEIVTHCADDFYTNATALVITFVVNNHLDPKDNELAAAWEKRFIEFMKEYASQTPNMTIAFSAERSIQDEIERQSQSDIPTILISYLVMFVYIAFALGQYKVYNNDLRYLMVKTKIVLGLAGVIIVLLSVTSSVGFYAFCGVPATLIIVEVVPFLVLAVGVDNIFILVQAYQRDRARHQESTEERIGRICGEVIPSMMLSSLSECVCFFLGSLSSMPAVKIFSLYAAMAIFFDFFLQITCFLALFTLDVKREETGRLEVCCCVQLPVQKEAHSDGFLYTLVRDYYTPNLLRKPVRVVVMIVFIGWFWASVATIHRIEVGLDQTLSMPDDSYVLHYFEALSEFLAVGPPVYFVVKGPYEYSDHSKQNPLCGSAGCYQDSLYGQVYAASRWKNRSYVAHPVSSWLDDYFDWLRPFGNPPCCRLYNGTDTFCPATVSNSSCVSCDADQEQGRPSERDFDRFIDDFLIDNPGLNCSKGGHAAYGRAVNFGRNQSIDGSYFMTYHTVLKTSADFVNALKNARQISDNITAMIQANASKDASVFPYSVFYVFYEQYLTVVREAIMQLCLSIGSIFVVATILLGLDFWSGAMISITIAMILIDLMGLMYVWDIPFNAIALVNLVMAIGIAVEFCAHIVRSFAVSVESTRIERAKESLSTMGSSVLSGITLTKFGGIVVLGFSHSKIFKIFYFRMYLGIVLYGALHGLVFLPVLLSFIGPPANKRKLFQRQRLENISKAAYSQSIGEPSTSRAINSYESDQRSPMIADAIGGDGRIDSSSPRTHQE